jgi:hypothetical protein
MSLALTQKSHSDVMCKEYQFFQNSHNKTACDFFDKKEMPSMHTQTPLAIVLAIAALLSACVSVPSMGEAPDANAPQLVNSGLKGEDGRELLKWDRPGAFGKVTGERKLLGDVACMIARIDLQAIGYHPKAKDVNGTEMPSGGYYCAQKDTQYEPAAMAPALTRPTAFGRVPDDAKARGDRTCAATNKTLEAIGYHPRALGESGAVIQGGGFFCAPKTNKPGAPAAASV